MKYVAVFFVPFRLCDENFGFADYVLHCFLSVVGFTSVALLRYVEYFCCFVSIR